tara:strand:- start:8187 stop:9320 length:1134 start_codon:yes stop_codon:yes gene_type:complete
MMDNLIIRTFGSPKKKREYEIKHLMSKGMTYDDAYKLVHQKTGKDMMRRNRLARGHMELASPAGYKFTQSGKLVKKSNLQGESKMESDKNASYHTKAKKKKKAKKPMYKKAIAVVAKKVAKKKKDNFGMLSVKAGIDNNPNPTKADKIIGAKMNKKAYAKDDFKPHMMYHGKKSKMAKTYEEHLALKEKGWGHTKTAATALTKSVLKHLKSGKGIKETAKQLKVDEDLVVGVARKNVQSKTTARAIGKEQNKNIIQRVMTGSKKTEKGLRDHAKASGGKEKKVIQNMLGKKQILGNRGSFKNLPKPAPKPAPKVNMKPKAEIVAVPNKDKAIDMGKVAPSMFDRAKKYMKDNAGMIAAGLGGTGTGYAMGKQANKKK